MEKAKSCNSCNREVLFLLLSRNLTKNTSKLKAKFAVKSEAPILLSRLFAMRRTVPAYLSNSGNCKQLIWRNARVLLPLLVPPRLKATAVGEFHLTISRIPNSVPLLSLLPTRPSANLGVTRKEKHVPINITDDIFTFRIRSRAVQVFDVVIIKCQTILKRKKKLLLQSRLKPAPFFVCNPFKCRLARFVWNK